MRDVAVVSFVYSNVARDSSHNETEMIVPVLQEAIVESGIAHDDIGFVCSGSLDYLQGGPFAFVADLGLGVRLIYETSARKNQRDAQRVANRRNY